MANGTYKAQIVPAGSKAVRLLVLKDGATCIDRTISSANVPFAVNAAKKVVETKFGKQIWKPGTSWQEFHTSFSGKASNPSSGRFTGQSWYEVLNSSKKFLGFIIAKDKSEARTKAEKRWGSSGYPYSVIATAENPSLKAHRKNGYVGFKALTRKLAKKGISDPAALAASIGRKKYGKKTFQKMALKGRTRKASAKKNPVLTDTQAKKLASVFVKTVKGAPYPKPSEFGSKENQKQAYFLGLLAEENGKYKPVEAYKNDGAYKRPEFLPASVLWKIVGPYIPKESIGKGTINKTSGLWEDLGLWKPSSPHHRVSDEQELENVLLKLAQHGLIHFNAAGSVWEISRRQSNPTLKGLKTSASKLLRKGIKSTKSALRSLTPAGRRAKKSLKRLLDAQPKGSGTRNPTKGWRVFTAYTDAKASASVQAPNGEVYEGTYKTNWQWLPVRRIPWPSAVTKKLAAVLKKREKFLREENPKIRKVTEKRKKNPETAAKDLYEKFHGEPSTNSFKVRETEHVHRDLGQLGTLVEIKVSVKLGGKTTLYCLKASQGAASHSDKKAVHLTSSEKPVEGSTKDSLQLFLTGGDQSLDLKKLGFYPSEIKEQMVIGQIRQLTYRTQKNFDKFETIDYYHGLGEENGNKPTLCYKPKDKKMLIFGGDYGIRKEGIVN